MPTSRRSSPGLLSSTHQGGNTLCLYLLRPSEKAKGSSSYFVRIPGRVWRNFRIWIPQKRKAIRICSITFLTKKPRTAFYGGITKGIVTNKSGNCGNSFFSLHDRRSRLCRKRHIRFRICQTHLGPLSPDIREIEDEIGEIDEFFDVSETRTPHALPTPGGDDGIPPIPTLSQSKLPRLEITSNIDTTNIIGGRTCRSSRRAAYLAELNVPPYDLLEYII